LNGTVDWLNRPALTLVVRGPYGHETVTAYIDTGFAGSLALPGPLLARLGTKPTGQVPIRLANGRTSLAYAHWVQLDWVDGPRRCIALETALDDCLVGRTLLDGHRLEIDFGTAKTVEVR
jgi:clan AA aspartic protease